MSSKSTCTGVQKSGVQCGGGKEEGFARLRACRVVPAADEQITSLSLCPFSGAQSSQERRHAKEDRAWT